MPFGDDSRLGSLAPRSRPAASDAAMPPTSRRRGLAVAGTAALASAALPPHAPQLLHANATSSNATAPNASWSAPVVLRATDASSARPLPRFAAPLQPGAPHPLPRYHPSPLLGAPRPLPPDEEVDPIWRIFDVPVGVAPWLFPQAVAYQVKHAGYTGAGFLIFICWLILIGSIVSTVVYPMY